ncbi:hypothetical protein AQUCO_00800199v1 [Aquilegia coerulea]|uniref:Cytochrome P450 n=1 Tax=Aquilegia coerulea TaxID=218851 RepID=A0A2G5EHR4_AQUCA|nr:hypothetical protein AQUCO_00800199v1 [Aquilegia coerulea]
MEVLLWLLRTATLLAPPILLSWLLRTATLIAPLILFFLAFYLRPHHRVNLPPGPKPWPIIGNLNLIGSLPHRSIHELSQVYGPIMQLQFGSFPVVVGSSVEMAKQFLKVNDLNFASRPKFSAVKYTTYDYTDIGWAPYGRYWRHVRKMCLTELLNTKKIDSYEYIRVEEGRALLFGLYASCGNPITLKDHFSDFTLNNITRMILSKKYLDKSKSKELKKIADEWFFLNGGMNIGDSIPWINSLDIQGYVKRMKAFRIKVDPFLEGEVDEHIARRHDHLKNEFVPKDIVDVLLQLADDPNPDLKLSRNNIKSITLDLFAGGVMSPTTIIEWALSELLKHPKLFEKATEELDKVIGRDRWVEEKDLPNLPYIKFIIYETMRMHPGAPMLAPHLARENCKIHGYDIVQGTQVLVNTWSIGRDPTLWDEPNEFCPERFLGRDIDVKGRHFELLPFGSGRRMCPGYSLGLKLIESGLANLLHGFTWKLPNHMMNPYDLNMDEVWGLSVYKKVPLVAVAQPRLPIHLYTNVI